MPHLPPSVAAILSALRLSGASRDGLGELSESGWKEVLAFSDRAQLTLPLLGACGAALPANVQERLQTNLAGNTERWARARIAYAELADALRSANIEWLVLKGFAHCPDYVGDPRWRVQYDFDLLVPEADARRACDVLLAIGYEPIGGMEEFPVDHLPTMVRKTGWQWRGDYFDPDIPFAVELHFRLWDPSTEHLNPSGLDRFWERRVERSLEDLRFLSLHPADALAHSSLHILRHLFRGDLRASHVYELACYLEKRAGDAAFWQTWRGLHDAPLRQLEAIGFALSGIWFACRMSAVAQEECDRLPSSVRRWLNRFAFSPIETLFHPNKDELWLHLSLLSSWPDKLAVIRRRLFPLRLPGPVDAVHIPKSQLTWRLRARRGRRYVGFLASRIIYHVRALSSVFRSAVRWWL